MSPVPSQLVEKLRQNVGRVILGKDDQVSLAVLALLTGGHVLMEDVPGVGKTVLAKSLARSVEADFKRIQFTPDLLPADVTGTSVFDPRDRTFDFKKGPVFANVVLADEINRASPRTQSALLEAMSESQVSADGTTRPLPDPFLVIATQNPIDFHGTYPLPEAQLDRFAVRIELGYPSAGVETDMLLAQARRHPFDSLAPVATLAEVREAREALRSVRVERAVAAYMVDLGRALRDHPSVRLGVSPRGSLALFRAAQAWAVAAGRDYCMPDDVKAVAAAVLAHRLVLEPKAKYAGVDPRDLVREVVDAHPVPV
jgi:MoxR-like ATPase